MAFAAMALATLVIWFDSVGWGSWVDRIPWLGSGDAEGARVLLSTVAGSMITVAGVTFSMTLIAVSHAGAQLGPRTLSNLLRDRGNQVTLGVFTATFLYCLLMLRAVDASEETSFVPRLGVLLALVLSIASVGVLIYFVHHVPRTIHATDVVARIGRRLREGIEATRPAGPEEKESGRFDQGVPTTAFGGRPNAVVRSEDVGYVNYVSHESLVSAAQARGCWVRVVAPAGQFVYEGTPLLELWGSASREESGSAAPFHEAFAIGTRRSLGQDVLFPADQLLEVAIRALSPGVNDPYTALECVDQLTAGAAMLASSPEPTSRYYDDQGALRVVDEPVRFPGFVQHVFERLRPYASEDALVALHTLRRIRDLSREVRRSADLNALVREARATLDGSISGLEEARAREAERHLGDILENEARLDA